MREEGKEWREREGRRAEEKENKRKEGGYFESNQELPQRKESVMTCF